MTTNTKQTVIVIVAAILLLLGMIYLATRSEQYFNNVPLTENVGIRNNSTEPYIDTVLHVGLQELDISPVYVIVRGMSNYQQTVFEQKEDKTLKAYIQGVGNQYLLYIDNVSRRECIDIVAHELIHLRQYRTGKLKINLSYVIWNGDTLTFEQLGEWEYLDRPWEIEARKDAIPLAKLMRTKLYNNE